MKNGYHREPAGLYIEQSQDIVRIRKARYPLSSQKRVIADTNPRLNDQHAFISSIGPPELLHPLIPRENVLRVADVATGTGSIIRFSSFQQLTLSRIWLEDLASAIEQTPTTEGQARQYDGFDISDTFFPQNHGPNSRYVIQDILKPFPSEYHGIYDLVHVKHLIVALKSTDLPTALQNLVQILGKSTPHQTTGQKLLTSLSARRIPPVGRI